ncbi:type VII secretion protein, YukD family [Lactococcus garvieae]|uniref:type VII secretion protein, YukD family n=1 Tax=Lactococcus garvieae TaxID=1363 RepID=UPI0030CB3E1C
MRKDTSIGIGLHVGKQIIDLQIPIKISGNRLKELLRESLELLNISLPGTFELEIINKPIKLNGEVLLANYALGDGDQFVVREAMKK